MMTLHPQLAADTYYLGDFPFCALLLSRDANYPWFILVPRQPDITELHQLESEDFFQCMRESMVLSETMDRVFNADKLNVAALGNVVPQLHIHHIARFTSDACWPKPVWGQVPAIAYDDDKLNSTIDKLLSALPEGAFTVKAEA